MGHVAHDLTPNGWRLGGTAAYSALTAQALDLRVGIVTAAGNETSLMALDGIQTVVLESSHSTTFENIYTENGRVQYLRAQALSIDFANLPEIWKRTSIIHIGPIANEIDSALPKDFSPAFLGITPQGWMRQCDETGRISRSPWKNAEPVLQKADAVVLSREDVNGDEHAY